MKSETQKDGRSKLKREFSANVNNGWEVTDNTMTPSKLLKYNSNWIEENIQNKQIEENLEFELHSEIKTQKFIRKFSESWVNDRKFSSNEVNLTNEPFKIAKIPSFIANDDKVIPNLVKEFSEIEWTRKEMDLYKFFQSKDLVSVTTPMISKFYQFLQTSVKPWMENLTNMKFKHVSASCSMYDYTDHLLIHDDLMTDRKIAFVFYLTPWIKTWNEDMGGALEFYKTNDKGLPVFPIDCCVYPSNNQLAFFKVCKKSFHSVGEVLTKDYPRLTLHGWFHGEVNADYEESTKFKGFERPMFTGSNERIKLALNKFVNKTYLDVKVKKTVQKKIEDDSEIALEDFLVEEFFNQISCDLKHKDLKWDIKNPANQQYYEYLKIDRVPGAAKKLYDLLSSPEMFKYLFELTELDLYGKQAKKPKFSAEFQKWTGGNYTLIGDQASFKDSTLDLIFYFGTSENVGVVTYLTPEENDDEEDPVLLTIYPRPNVLNIVYRAEGTTKFTNYVPKHVGRNEQNYILVVSYKE